MTSSWAECGTLTRITSPISLPRVMILDWVKGHNVSYFATDDVGTAKAKRSVLE